MKIVVVYTFIRRLHELCEVMIFLNHCIYSVAVLLQRHSKVIIRTNLAYNSMVGVFHLPIHVIQKVHSNQKANRRLA